MKKYYSDLRNWCNSNQGILALLGILFPLLLALPFNKLDFTFTNSFLEKILIFLSYQAKVPIYLLLLAILSASLYIIRLKKRYATKNITLKFLKGTWKNEWIVNEDTGTETLYITDKGDYIINNEHWFNVEDFIYDDKKRLIKFTKVGIRENDGRRLLNTLKIENNELLIGMENNYKIKYTKISD